MDSPSRLERMRVGGVDNLHTDGLDCGGGKLEREMAGCTVDILDP